MMQGVHVKLNPVLPWQRQQSTKRKFFIQKHGLKFKEEASEILRLEHDSTVLKFGHF